MKRTSKKRRYTEEFIKQLTGKLKLWINQKDSIWLGDFAADNKMSRQRLSEIANENELFAEVYEYTKQIQENKLFKLGLSKNCNPAMAIFALKNVAGWRDRTDITTGDEPITGVEVTIRKSKK